MELDSLRIDAASLGVEPEPALHSGNVTYVDSFGGSV